MNDESMDIRNNWNTTYSESKFKPSKAFDGEEIDPGNNRHLQGDTSGEIHQMDNLDKYSKSHFGQLHVKSIWIIKNRDNDGFQGWHRDFYLKMDIISTIVVNVGVHDVM